MEKAKQKKNSKKKQIKGVKLPEVDIIAPEKKANEINKVNKRGTRTNGRGNPNYDDTKIKERIAKDKAKILVELENTFGIVTNAIAKVGISNVTFYKYFKNDLDFAKAVEEIQNGFDVIVEDKLKQKIIQNDGHSIRFYLSHRVAKYKPKVGFGQDPDAKPIELIIETYNPDDECELGEGADV